MDTRRLDGLTIAVTGATSGIGYFVAEGLARAGADVVLAGRSPAKAERAIASLPRPEAHRFVELDLADLGSTREAGGALAGGRLDGLVMNAGVIAAPRRYQEAAQLGVESTVATNFLAHVELLRLALPALEAAEAARVVSTGSMITRRIGFSRENWLARQSYRPRVAYAMSKHAVEIFGFELGRRLRARGSAVESLVVHPGGAIDALTPDRPGVHERSPFTRVSVRAFAPVLGRVVHGKDGGARPAVLAMTGIGLPEAAYLGPRGGITGEPVLADPVSTSRDPELGAWLWREAERLLGAPVFAEAPTRPA